MAVITTGAHPKALWPGVQAWFGAKYDEHPVECTALFDTSPRSKKNFEEDVQMTGFGLMPAKPEGNATTYDDHSQDWVKRYVPTAYSMGYIVTKEELDDNLYLERSFQRAGMLAFSARQTKENVGANVYNRAFDSGYLGGDAKELLATDHPQSSGGTFSNELAVAANLSEASLEDIAIQIANATNPRGLKISLRPTSLVVPPALMFEAQRILKSTLQSDTANNDTNALRTMGVIPKVTINHYLTSTTAWFVRTNCPNGLKFIPRIGLEFTQDNDFDTENAKAKCYERYDFGWTDPRGLYGSAGV